MTDHFLAENPEVIGGFLAPGHASADVPVLDEGHAVEGACDLCWGEAFKRSRMLGGSQVDHYKTILKETSR